MMPQLRQYPTDQQLKDSIAAYKSGKLGDYLKDAAAKRAAARAELEKG